MKTTYASLVLCLVTVTAAASASAERPMLLNEATYRGATSDIVVHYATTGVDRPELADADNNGVPDFVEQVHATAAFALENFTTIGFSRPLRDGRLGGDDGIDIYLRNVQNSDGNAGTDSCLDNRCVGFAVVENDFRGFIYTDITQAIDKADATAPAGVARAPAGRWLAQVAGHDAS